MDHNDWFFKNFKGGAKPRSPQHAAVVMAVLWLFIIAGVVSSIALAFNLRGAL